MTPASRLRLARTRAGLTLRALAERAGTSHTALAAYESGAKIPRVDTFERIMWAAGFESRDVAVRPPGDDPVQKGEDLVDVLLLAEQFPARHSRTLPYPSLAAALSR